MEHVETFSFNYILEDEIFVLVGIIANKVLMEPTNIPSSDYTLGPSKTVNNISLASAPYKIIAVVDHSSRREQLEIYIFN